VGLRLVVSVAVLGVVKLVFGVRFGLLRTELMMGLRSG